MPGQKGRGPRSAVSAATGGDEDRQVLPCKQRVAGRRCHPPSPTLLPTESPRVGLCGGGGLSEEDAQGQPLGPAKPWDCIGGGGRVPAGIPSTGSRAESPLPTSSSLGGRALHPQEGGEEPSRPSRCVLCPEDKRALWPPAKGAGTFWAGVFRPQGHRSFCCVDFKAKAGSRVASGSLLLSRSWWHGSKWPDQLSPGRGPAFWQNETGKACFAAAY